MHLLLFVSKAIHNIAQSCVSRALFKAPCNSFRLESASSLDVAISALSLPSTSSGVRLAGAATRELGSQLFFCQRSLVPRRARTSSSCSQISCSGWKNGRYLAACTPPSTVNSNSTKTARGTCFPAPLSEKVLDASSLPSLVLSLSIRFHLHGFLGP